MVATQYSTSKAKPLGCGNHDLSLCGPWRSIAAPLVVFVGAISLTADLLKSEATHNGVNAVTATPWEYFFVVPLCPSYYVAISTDAKKRPQSVSRLSSNCCLSKDGARSRTPVIVLSRIRPYIWNKEHMKHLLPKHFNTSIQNSLLVVWAW